MNNTIFKASPLVIITVVSLIIFSLVGTASITGQMTAVNSGTSGPAARSEKTGIEPNITPIIGVKSASAQNVEQAKLCDNCAVVDSIIVNEVKVESGGVGTVPGSVANGQPATMSAYLVKIRMYDGTYRVVSQQDQPVFHVGEKVKIVNGKIVNLENAAKMDNNHIIALMLAALTGRVF
jgi:intracellular sulfur oxidation DsrE/DsrF family protein